MNVNEKGDLAVFKTCLRAAEKGYVVSKPLSDSCRYDLIIDVGNKLLRAQVKYADGKSSLSSGVARVGLEKKDRTGRVTLYNKQEIDMILVYLPVVDKMCCFSSEDFTGKRNLFIRYQPAKNNQAKKCRFLEDCIW